MKTKVIIVFFTLLTTLLNISCKRDNSSLLNLDFEQIDSKSKLPAKWTFGPSAIYKLSLDSTIVHSGKYSIKMERIGKNNSLIDNIGGSRLLENIQPNKSLKLTAFIKTENIDLDSNVIYIGYHSIEGDTIIRLIDKSLLGTNDWKEYNIQLPIKGPQDFYYIAIGFSGEGRIWVDDLRLYVDDKQLLKLPDSPKFVANKEELKWLKNHSTTIKTVHPESGFEDMEPLKKMIGNARIVGLGENTHGSGEVFKMKHRLVEFLAKEMGFTIFSIEANMPEAYKINDYILENKQNCDPKSLLKGMYFWTWNTQEVLDMILWMKKFNNTGEGKIQFTGFDMQYYMGSIQNLNNFAEKYDSHFKYKTDSLSALFDKLKLKGAKAIEFKEELANINQKCQGIFDYLIKNKTKISELVGEKEYKWLLQNANVLIQCIELAHNANNGYMYRDKSMANNVEWILDNNPNAKIILWAHNGHISKKNNCMGSFLAKKYGNEYYNIGFLSNSGSYTAVNKTHLSSNNLLTVSKPGSYEYSFHKIKQPIFYFDFSHANENVTESRWLFNRLNYRSIGAVAMDNQFYQTRLNKEFNAIIYIDSQNASKCFDVK